MTSYETTDQADEDLIAIYIHGYGQFGARQADRYFDKLKDLFQRLADNPRLTRLRTEFEPPIQVFTYGNHVVIYEPSPEGIVILRVRHGHEDWQSDPRGLDSNEDNDAP